MVRLAYQALFTTQPEPRAWYQIIGWWEARRPAYNAVLFVAGIASVLVLVLFDSLPPNPDFEDYESFSIFFFAIFANFFFTFGWVVELGVQLLSRDSYKNVGPRLFRAGLIFSLIMTAIPGVVAMVRWIWRLT